MPDKYKAELDSAGEDIGVSPPKRNSFSTQEDDLKFSLDGSGLSISYARLFDITTFLLSNRIKLCLLQFGPRGGKEIKENELDKVSIFTFFWNTFRRKSFNIELRKKKKFGSFSRFIGLLGAFLLRFLFMSIVFIPSVLVFSILQVAYDLTCKLLTLLGVVRFRQTLPNEDEALAIKPYPLWAHIIVGVFSPVFAMLLFLFKLSLWLIKFTVALLELLNPFAWSLDSVKSKLNIKNAWLEMVGENKSISFSYWMGYAILVIIGVAIVSLIPYFLTYGFSLSFAAMVKGSLFGILTTFLSGVMPAGIAALLTVMVAFVLVAYVVPNVVAMIRHHITWDPVIHKVYKEDDWIIERVSKGGMKGCFAWLLNLFVLPEECYSSEDLGSLQFGRDGCAERYEVASGYLTAAYISEQKGLNAEYMKKEAKGTDKHYTIDYNETDKTFGDTDHYSIH